MAQSKAKKKAARVSKADLAIRQKVREEKREAQRKKRRRIVLITVASFIGALAIALILLGVLKPDVSVRMSGDYKPYAVLIITDGGYTGVVNGYEIGEDDSDAEKEAYDDFLKAYVDGTDFSYLNGIMHQKWFPKMSVTLDDDGEPTVDAVTINSIVGSGEQPLAVALFDEPVTQTIRGTEITYDLMYFHFADTGNNMREFQVFLVEEGKLNNPDPRVKEGYRAYRVSCVGNLTGMWKVYEELSGK